MKRSRDEFDGDDLPSRPDSPTSSQDTGVKIVRFAEEAVAPPVEVVRCSLPGHPELSFSTYEEYENHYNQTHLWRCQSCRRNFPSEHFLDLHIEENHDSLAKVRLERGEKIYACFLPDCPKKCSSTHRRELHLRFGHGFPEDYDFQMIRTGFDGRTSLLKSGRPKKPNRKAQQNDQSENGHRNAKPSREPIEKPSWRSIEQPKDKSSKDLRAQPSNKFIGPMQPNTKENGDASVGAETAEKMDEDQSSSAVLPPPKADLDTEMDDITSAMSSLKFVPPAVRFGRGNRRGFSRN